MAINKSIKEAIEAADAQLLIDVQKLKNSLGDPREEDRRDVQSDTSSNMFDGDAMSIFTSMETLCSNEFEGSEEGSEEESEDEEVSSYDSDSDEMITETENDSKWTRLVTREQLMVHWNQYLNSSPQVEGTDD
jgi:hypothetical protein